MNRIKGLDPENSVPEELWTEVCNIVQEAANKIIAKKKKSKKVKWLSEEALQIAVVSPTRWTWVWVNSGSWWWTGRLGVLWFMGLQRIRHDWVTELNWTELKERRESKKQDRKGKLYPTKCRVPKNSTEGKEAFFNEQCLKLEENTTEGEILEISSGKLEISRERFAQTWAQ